MSGQTNFLSPIRLVGPMINGCDYYVDQAGPRGGVQVEVNLVTPDDVSLSHEPNAFALHFPMQVRIRLYEDNADNGADAAKEVMHAFLSMTGAVVVSDEVALTEGEILEALRLNAVSMFYSAARSYIENLTSMSSVGRFTIPPIDPQAYLRTLAELEKDV